MTPMLPVVSPEQRKQLLRYAREVAHWSLGGRRAPGPAKPDVGGRFGGAFVTFYAGKALRGCVGTFLPSVDLAAMVEQVTQSSLSDPRFASNPITLGELSRLAIEVSVLTDPELTHDPSALVPGRHGIIVRRGERSGCFLPKVATERGWSAEEFLSNCCTMKAGLARDAWKDAETSVYVFLAEVFSELDA